MRTLQKIILINLSLLFSLLVVGCKKEPLPMKPVASSFSVTSTIPAIIPVEGGVYSLKIEGGTNGWWVTLSEETTAWLNVNRKYGSGDVSQEILIEANASGQKREMQLVIRSTSQVAPVIIKVNQN